VTKGAKTPSFFNILTFQHLSDRRAVTGCHGRFAVSALCVGYARRGFQAAANAGFATQRSQHFRFSLNSLLKPRSLRGVARDRCDLKTALHIPPEMHRQGNDGIFITRTTNQPIRKTQKNQYY
jgi:hypothetical protein